MEKKFKCQSCGHEFVADTNQYVTCPQCDSDNVAIAKKKSPVLMIVLIAVAVFILALGGVFAVKHFGNASETDSIPVPEPLPVPHEQLDQEIEEGIEKALPEQIAWVSLGTPQYDEATDTYTIKVEAKIPDGATASYEVSELVSGKVIATNANGLFVKLAPIAKSAGNPESAYNVTARAMKNNQCVDSISQMVSGFTPVVKNVTPMTAAELQTLINNKDIVALSNNPKIASHVEIVCQGNLGDATPPTGLTQIVTHIKMGNWDSVKVNSVGLDSRNCINKVVITPVLPD